MTGLGVPEDTAVRIIDVLDDYGPFEVRCALNPDATRVAVVRCMTDGDFEVAVVTAA